MWVFGTGLAADCVISELETNSLFLTGVCVDDEYFIEGQTIRGHAVVPLSKVNTGPNPGIFIATGYKDLNRQRGAILRKVKGLGFVPQNIIPSRYLKRLSAFGQNNFIMEDACLHPQVALGDNVFIWGGANVCHHVEIGSDVWLTAGSTIAGNTKLGSNIFVGANATIASGLSIGSNSFIGANALVTNDLPNNSAVVSRASEILKVNADFFVKYIESRGNY